ncbi:hypothetical protein CDQ84_15400 [Clostridium thermosuccinogenes]|jgi:YbbR domain-containing protein|uniref:YbbR-like protein n=1 Tax=Clostridium thermosuccinogenes TaxID=84032 RepID=A0A2K2F978_9CLOT|nr:CdaR family protein [Pseudoclostridium thermosuccinogenes]AUS96788.1 hypothetical protein CDO33_10250 [Pseudoclostridium thermosuccinogenes]PNT95352.1 hypothetical protein CDQ85_15255 [Pseudoclostridium thermosuccinogenes]PNT96366.1 hypothetical protein CDQ84_15400 [Pseudoclostridium thermosuccinogenes]
MNEWLKNDTIMKIVSVLFAIGLWLAVNPVNTMDYTINLNVINEDDLHEKNIELKNRNFPKTIQVRVRGKKDKLTQVSESDFQAVLDFSQIDSVDDNTIKIPTPEYTGKVQGVKVLQYWPTSVRVSLEKIISRSFKVEIGETKGELKPGYKVAGIKINQDRIVIRDLESVVNQVESVKVDINLDNLNESISDIKKCKVYDKNGKEIPQHSNKYEVEVLVEIAKEVPVVAEKTGSIPDGYVGGISKYSPTKVLITGPGDVLDKITSLKTEPFNLSGITENTDITAPLVLPEGVKLVDPDQKITASVTVEALKEKTIRLGKNMITIKNMDASSEYAIQTEEVAVVVKGLQKDLEKVNALTLKPYVNVIGLEEGTHSMPLMFDYSGNVDILGRYEVELLVKKKVEEEDLQLQEQQ